MDTKQQQGGNIRSANQQQVAGARIGEHRWFCSECGSRGSIVFKEGSAEELRLLVAAVHAGQLSYPNGKPSCYSVRGLMLDEVLLVGGGEVDKPEDAPYSDDRLGELESRMDVLDFNFDATIGRLESSFSKLRDNVESRLNNQAVKANGNLAIADKRAAQVEDRIRRIEADSERMDKRIDAKAGEVYKLKSDWAQDQTTLCKRAVDMEERIRGWVMEEINRLRAEVIPQVTVTSGPVPEANRGLGGERPGKGQGGMQGPTRDWAAKGLDHDPIPGATGRDPMRTYDPVREASMQGAQQLQEALYLCWYCGSREKVHTCHFAGQSVTGQAGIAGMCPSCGGRAHPGDRCR